MTNVVRVGVIKSLDDIVMKPAPIEPSWILNGQPTARSGSHSENIDGRASTNVWDCTAGSFRWHFVWEETVMILEGEVHVTNDAGQKHVLNAGSIGYFPGGTWWTWEVPVYVRKIAFCRALSPGWMQSLSKLKAAARKLPREPLKSLRSSIGISLVAVAASVLLVGALLAD